MSAVPQAAEEAVPTPDLETDVENAIAVCDGDARAAVRALLVANDYLARELERVSAAVSRGYARARLTRFRLNASGAAPTGVGAEPTARPSAALDQ